MLFHELFFDPFSTWLYIIHWIMRTLTFTQVCPPLLIDSTNGCYNNIGLHSSSLWSVFLAGLHQWRALERIFVALDQQHGYALPCLPEIYEIRTYNLDTQW